LSEGAFRRDFPKGRNSGMRIGPRLGWRPCVAGRGVRRHANDIGPLAQGHAGSHASLDAVRTEEATGSACALVNGFEELPAKVAPPGKEPASMAVAVSAPAIYSGHQRCLCDIFKL
jgi:hypothetical protein